VPDHSTFTKSRHGRFRDGDLFRHLFESVVARCISEGLVGVQTFAPDASLIRADANKQYASAKADWDPGRKNVTSAPRAVREYLEVLDDAAFGAASEVEPKFTSFADPASQWTGARKRSAFFAYSDNYLFAHLKRILRLDRLRLRGPNGARDEFLLAATAQNLRKLAKLILRSPAMA
jgi:hypothetical protein